MDNVDNFYLVEVNCYKIVTFVTKYIHANDAFTYIIAENSAVFMTHLCMETMDNSVILYTVLYRTYIRVSVFLHFTEIYRTSVHKYPNETKISLA